MQHMARLNEPPQPATESIDACESCCLYYCECRLTIQSKTAIRQTESRDSKVCCSLQAMRVCSDHRRANSTQSVRIRNLECEVSRLLGENVSLREESIRLQHEVEKNTSKHVLEEVDTVKVKLEAKLSELGTLLRELGDVRKTNDIQRTQKRRSISRSSPKGSPDQRIWKNTLTLSEAFGGAEGRLPPIVEDKYYPRRTLE